MNEKKEKDLNKNPAEGKKELTPKQIQKRKKMLIFPLFFLIFAGSMWLIFAPGDKEQEQSDGLNVNIPMPKDKGLISDKRDAYEQEASRERQQEKMRSLNDFAFQIGETDENSEDYQRQIKLAPVPPDYQEELNRQASARDNRSNAFQSSMNQYEDINRQLGSFYTDTSAEDEQEKLEMEYRIQELERKLEEENEAKRIADQQLMLMEKSYEMASRYMPGGTPSGEDQTNGEAISTKDKIVVQPVKQVRSNVVSLLAAPMDDDEFIEAFSQPRNMGFFTAAGNERIQDKNSIRACVYQTATLTSGKELQMRLLEPMRAGNIVIPANTVVTGTCRIGSERMDVTINSIQYADNIIPVEITVYDMDGQKGISVPNSDEIKAAKEVASSLAQSAGTSIMISDNAGSQLAADMGKGLIQGASQYASKKMSVVKVTLKANYKLLLLPKEQ